MKTPLIAFSAALSLLIAGCDQKPAQITSTSLTPSPSPEDISPASVTSSTVTESVVTAPSPSASATSNGQLLFTSKGSTEAANEYLNAYSAVLNDINAKTVTKDTDPETALSNAIGQLRNLARDTNQLANQQVQVQQQLTPDEKKRLLQYRKNLEKGASQQNSGL